MRTLLAAVVAAAAVFTLVSPAPAADPKPVNVLIITGDHGHKWQETTPFLKDLLSGAGMKVDVTETPSKDLTPANLAKYDVLFLNYKDTKNGSEATRWSDENKRAFADAVKGGKGLLVYHHASSAFTSGTEWDKEFERITAGGWRKQGHHGKKHVFTVEMVKPDHPITKDLPKTFEHSVDELYQNSLLFPDCDVLVTSWSDPAKDPKNTGKHEPAVWVTKHGEGRVCNNALGHDVAAMQDKGFQTLMIRCVEWTATGDAKAPVPAELKSAAAAAPATQPK
jgi:type 1 glutamine amidotransferase